MAAEPTIASPIPDLLSLCLAITQNAPLPTATVEGATRIVRYANPAFCRLMGKPLEALVGNPFDKLLPEKDQCVTLIERVFRTKTPASYTEQEPTHPHPVFWSYTIWPVMEEQGLVGVMIQVTETAKVHGDTVAMNEALLLGSIRQHELTEAADTLNAQLRAEIIARENIASELSEKARKLSQKAKELAEKARLLDLTKDAIIVLDPDGRISYWNHGAEELYGWSSEEALGKRSHALLKTEYPAPMTEAALVEELYRNGRWAGELLHTTRDGRRITVLARKTLDRDSQGNPAAVLQTLTDISERKLTEAALRQSAGLFSTLVEHAPIGMYVVDAQFRMQQVNALAQPVFATVEPLIGRDFSEIVRIVWGPEVGDGLAEIFRHTLETGERYSWPAFSERRQDLGVEQSYEWEAQRVTLPDGRYGVVCYFTDITARLHAAEALLAEVAERKQAEEQVRLLNRDLEQRVAQRVEELATKARLLAERNAEVELARLTLEEKAAELALTSKYKSEFLANMSHELRTPLNSILILSQQLAENAPSTLNPKQVEFSRNINSSGSDLLHLINDILDLSKIESGTVTVEVEEIPFAELRGNLDRNFRHVAEAKNLPFNVHFAEGLPKVMDSDPKRLQQILKNLLSNAVKFTAHGKVEVRVDLATQGWSADHPVLSKAPQVVAFAVEDTGIGIAPEKQRLIFEAFQQADAGTSRKYGGTGLGLAISRELAVLLGGEIKLSSVHGQGSTFTLFLPLHYSGPNNVRTTPSAAPASQEALARGLAVLPVAREEHIEDDRNAIAEGDPVLLIIEDDPHYARILLGLARDKGFKGVVAQKGAMGLSLARQFRPTAVSLDIFLPDMLGWTVLNQLKLDPTTRHIPVQIVTLEEERQHGLEHGAFNYLIKSPTTAGLEASFDRIKEFTVPRTKRLLVVEDNAIERQSVVELLGHQDIEIDTAGTGAEALSAMLGQTFDCVVLDLRLPDMTGFDLLEKMHAEPELADVPVVVFTGKDLTSEEQTRLKTMAKSIVLKDVQSPERLLDETALFLHRVITDLPAEKQAMLERLHSSSEVLRGRKVLVVDDDARNIFALTSLLENHEMEVISTTNGRSAIEIIQQTPDLSLVLMDIMMPGSDGYATLREIRSAPEYRALPIIALTAKAMKGDREKCLDAGASDYIAKPVDTDQLLSLMRGWLFR